ncbi:unnamed protein product [Camellia sinensis]
MEDIMDQELGFQNRAYTVREQRYKSKNLVRGSSSCRRIVLRFSRIGLMDICEIYTFRHYVGRPARHLWRKVSIVLRFAICLSFKKLADHHKQRDQYRPSPSSSSSAGLMEIDPFDHCAGIDPLLHHLEYGLSSSSSALRSPGKVAYICVCTIDKYEWYAFDVSDDIKHNQTPPPAKYINYPVPFHEDDESGVVNLKPQVTANMDWILGWEILGFKKLYVLDDWKGPLASGESNRVDRIDVGRISFYPWEWEPVQNMPNQITASAHTCVLGGKFYCLGGGHRSQKVESVRKSQLAMPYYLSLKAGSSAPPPPPCLDIDKILSASKEVHKPYLPSQSLGLEGQSPNSESDRDVHKQLSSAIEVAISKRYLLEKTIYMHYFDNNYSSPYSYIFFVQQKYYIEKLFYHNCVRQKYFHKKLISAMKYAQPCSLSLNYPVMDYFLKAISLVEEFFRPSVEEYEQILKTSVEEFHIPSVEEFHKPLVEFVEFHNKSFEEFEWVEEFHKALIQGLEKFVKLSTKEFKDRPSVEESHMLPVEKFLRPQLPSVEEFFKPRFPSQNMQLELERQSPWIMAYDTRQKKWESLLDPPYLPIKIDNIFTAAREFPNQCFVVGLPEDCVLQIYHVNTQQWEVQEFKICPKFGPKVLTGPALSVDSKLYWYSVDDHCLVGYDLETKMWFMGNFPIHDHGERFGVLDVDTPPCLAHLRGDDFCLLWVSVLQHKSMKSSESKDNFISRLHCMKLRVTTGNLHPESGIISLEVSILSCQSYLAPGLKFFRGGLVGWSFKILWCLTTVDVLIKVAELIMLFTFLGGLACLLKLRRYASKAFVLLLWFIN